MRKSKIKIKLYRSGLRIMTPNRILLVISWRMPLRLIVMAKIVDQCCYYIPKSSLNVLFNVGDIIEFDAKGIQVYLEILGKGFKYSRYKYYYPDGIVSNQYIKTFEWIK